MDNLQLAQGGNFAFASGALANGTAAGSIKTTVIVPYTVDGQFASKAITDNIAFTVAVPATFSTPSNGSFTGAVGGSVRLYSVLLDAAGTVTYGASAIVNVADLAAGLVALPFPPPVKGKTCIGAVRIALTASTTFVPNTTALGAAGVTTTYLNLSSIPGEPLKV